MGVVVYATPILFYESHTVKDVSSLVVYVSSNVVYLSSIVIYVWSIVIYKILISIKNIISIGLRKCKNLVVMITDKF